MGCYNGTCNISNMPIFEGDKVVFFPLMKVHDGAVFNTCYPTDNFIPLGFPFVGYYNDYGGLQDIEISDVNRDYFKSLTFYFKDKEEDNKYIRVREYDTFEDFVNNVLCVVEGCFVDVQNRDLHPNGKAEINYMMIHYDLYQSLMANMRNRKPYGEIETFESILTGQFKSDFISETEKIKTFNESLDSNNSRKDTMMNLYFNICVDNIKRAVFNGIDTFFEERWHYFVNEMLNNESIVDEVIKCAVDKYIFTIVLSRMRKGYLCDSGCGSQSAETKLHLIMAEFIQKQVMKNAERYGDIAKIKGVEEPLFF